MVGEKIKIVCRRNIFNKFIINYYIRIGDKIYITFIRLGNHKNINPEKRFRLMNQFINVVAVLEPFTIDRVEHVFWIDSDKLIDLFIRNTDLSSRSLIKELKRWQKEKLTSGG